MMAQQNPSQFIRQLPRLNTYTLYHYEYCNFNIDPEKIRYLLFDNTDGHDLQDQSYIQDKKTPTRFGWKGMVLNDKQLIHFILLIITFLNNKTHQGVKILYVDCVTDLWYDWEQSSGINLQFQVVIVIILDSHYLSTVVIVKI